MVSTGTSLTRWEPENDGFWQSQGERVARRTLWITTGALTLSFSTWFMWSVIVVKLQGLGFKLSDGQLFWLAALPGLVGATLRIPYSFLVGLFGTRAVISLATASLLIPAVGVGLAVQDPTTPFWVLALLACAAGFGGGNFSAFMSSTSYFFPKKKQGTALGLQAGIGNFGVSLVQLITPFVIVLGIQYAAFVWVVPVILFAVAAAVGLRSLPVKTSLGQQAVIFKRKHTWIMTSLYVMTFGTFSGFSASFALLIKKEFGGFAGAPDPLRYAFLGALIGSATRPVAGWISDKIGGAKVTIVSGVLLLGASLGITAFTAPTSVAQFPAFLTLILVVFFAAGVGNGSTFRMIPIIFPAKEAAPVLGWTAAVGAYGAFIVPMVFKWSFARFHSPNVAFFIFAGFYALNLVLCWWFYTRARAEVAC